MKRPHIHLCPAAHDPPLDVLSGSPLTADILVVAFDTQPESNLYDFGRRLVLARRAALTPTVRDGDAGKRAAVVVHGPRHSSLRVPAQVTTARETVVEYGGNSAHPVW